MKIIEKKNINREYGFNCQKIIIDHPKHGRLLVTDGYGEDGLNGSTIRWKHGLVIKLLPNDTFLTLEKPWNETETILSAALNGCDKTRPILPLDGYMIEKMMESLIKSRRS